MLPSQIPAADPEIVALASGLADVITSVMAKGTLIQDLESGLTDFLAAGQAVANVGVDIKKPANQAYIAWALAQALEPKA